MAKGDPQSRLIGNHRETAELLGISEQALWKAAKERGCPVLRAAGDVGVETLYDWRQVMQWRCADLRSRDNELTTERARLARAQADKTEMELAEMRAELIARETVSAHWSAMVGAMRAKLLSVPTKSAAQIVEPSKIAEATAVIRAFQNEALLEIAGDEFPPEIRARIDKYCGEGGSATSGDDGQPVGGHSPDAKPGRKRRARKVEN